MSAFNEYTPRVLDRIKSKKEMLEYFKIVEDKLIDMFSTSSIIIIIIKKKKNQISNLRIRIHAMLKQFLILQNLKGYIK